MEFIDTNLILRYLTRDHPQHSVQAARAFLQIALGQLIVTTSESVISEVVYVLSSKKLYSLPRSAVQAHLTAIIRLKGLKLPYKKSYLRALDLYASKNVPFVDALIVAHMERTRISTVLSFDHDFDRIPTVVRREP